jgi:hypothetical protein
MVLQCLVCKVKVKCVYEMEKALAVGIKVLL